MSQTSAARQPHAGIILAGGLGRRMGGGDKPLLELGGTPMLARVIDRLAPQVERIVINANGDPARFARYDVPVVPDTIEGFAGPLAGILAALDWAAAHRPNLEWVASAAADSPFLPPNFVARLHAAREAAGTPLACAESGGQAHPVNALWLVSLRADLRHALVVEDMHKIDRWTARHGIAQASWPAEPIDQFFNANTPDDLEEANRMMALYPA